MPILDAALAFALTMLVVATAVSQIVRLGQKIAKLRSAELRKMLTDYFGKELQPVVQREMNRLKKNITEKVASELAETANNLKESEVFDEDELATLIEVSTEELTERLKRSSMGQKLLTELGAEAQAVFDELGRRYEVIGDKFTASFRNKSRKWATGIALVLAIAFNIDSLHILDSYIRNEGMRESVIAQRDAFVDDYNALVESLEKEEGKDSVTKAELEQSFSDSQKQLDVLTSVGFPVGWSYVPNSPEGWVMWVFGILLTAGLAGLGAPFWFDTVTGISRVAQRARAARKAAA